MKKCLKFFLFICILFFCCPYIFAISISSDYIDVDIALAPAQFAMQSDWINADSYITFVGDTELKYETLNPSEEITSQQSFFPVFDYIPNTDNTLIDSSSLSDIMSVKSESNVELQIKYNDSFNLPVSSGYPKLYYRPQNSTNTYTEVSLTSTGGNIYSASLALDYGAFEYYVTATNEQYPGIYSTENNKKIFVVTERPHSFTNLNTNLQDDNATANASVNFRWSAEKGVPSDILKYTLYLGTSESSMQRYDLNTQSSYTMQNLSSRTRYYWKVEVENQYGAKLLYPIVYNFVTLGEIKRAYNAPNPFNPQKGQETRIFFEMTEEGRADIDIYSEYGDKIFHVTCNNLTAGNNEYSYKGKDDFGSNLYNGTYLCIINKKYSSGHTSTEKCRLLIIK